MPLARRDVADGPAEDLGAARCREDELHQQLERGASCRRRSGPRKPKTSPGSTSSVRPSSARYGSRAPEADRVVLGQLLDVYRWGHVAFARETCPLYLVLWSSSSDQDLEVLGWQNLPSASAPLMKKVGVDFTPSSWPRPASVLTLLHARVLRVEVGDARRRSAPPSLTSSGVSMVDPGARRSSPRAFRTCPWTSP